MNNNKKAISRNQDERSEVVPSEHWRVLPRASGRKLWTAVTMIDHHHDVRLVWRNSEDTWANQHFGCLRRRGP